MKIKWIILFLCFLFALSGCSVSGASDSKASSQTVANLDAVRMERIDKQHYTYTVMEFDVGSGTYESPAGRKMPYYIGGIIGVPDGEGPFPLVLITHGSHSNEDESLRFDTGYRYLVEALARQGLIAVSMDLSKAYIWKYGDNDDREKSQYLALEHLSSLERANKGESQSYPVNLAGKLDMTKIALIGHSRGGETIFDIAEDMQEKGMPVTALLCVAPTYLFDDRAWPDAKVALVIPEYDGDVISLDGIALYDVLKDKTQGEQLAVYLKAANHNYFNSNIERNDTWMQASSRDISDQMTRERQEAFLTAFASDFLYCSLQSGAAYMPLDSGQPDILYGEKASVLYHNAQSQTLLAADGASSYTAENLKVEAKTDAWFFRLDELLVDTITYGRDAQQTRRLLQIGWESVPAALATVPSTTDWTGYQTLTLDVLADPADEKNAGLSHQFFSVRLSDAQGNSAMAKISAPLQALAVAPGSLDVTELSEDEKIYFWSIRTPLSSLLFPLSIFEGVNLSEIQTVELVFGDAPKGSILLESVRIQ